MPIDNMNWVNVFKQNLEKIETGKGTSSHDLFQQLIGTVSKKKSIVDKKAVAEKVREMQERAGVFKLSEMNKRKKVAEQEESAKSKLATASAKETITLFRLMPELKDKIIKGIETLGKSVADLPSLVSKVQNALKRDAADSIRRLGFDPAVVIGDESLIGFIVKTYQDLSSQLEPQVDLHLEMPDIKPESIVDDFSKNLSPKV
jgi:hypothetical protein